MTFLRRLWAVLMPLVVSRSVQPTIAELRKATFTSRGERFTRTYEKDAKKLAGSRARGKVRDLHQWTAKYDRPRRTA